ncbi:MAG TPA: hypothetical protein VHN20_00270, partial [Beijerinckiaceae bacterium]|nr:hypothetical protein [Beijerinckiaceae bacterium]
DAAVISCSAHYQKMRSLFVAFFGSGGNDLDTAIRTRAAGDRRYIAAIVAAIRAEVAKRAGPPGRAGEPAPSPEGEGRLY